MTTALDFGQDILCAGIQLIRALNESQTSRSRGLIRSWLNHHYFVRCEGHCFAVARNRAILN